MRGVWRISFANGAAIVQTIGKPSKKKTDSSMRIVITGAGGFIGRTLVAELLRQSNLVNRLGQPVPIEQILLVDTYLPTMSDPRIQNLPGSLNEPEILKQIAEWKPDSVFHLAAILTSAAELDPAGSLTVNVSALSALVAAISSRSAPPRLIFPSSIAVFGGLLPDKVDDDHLQMPQTSYGTHKSIAELMLADASRHGLIDARSLRLPIVLVHPGPPTSSVSDRIAAIVRDCVDGRATVCPLRPDTRVPVVSVQTVVSNLIRLHNAESAKLIGRRALNQPSLTISMAEIAASVSRVLDIDPGSISFVPDPDLKKIVDGWPTGFISTRAAALGIVSDKNFEDIVTAYLKHHESKKIAV